MAPPPQPCPHPITPDGRYFVVRGRLWRMANPQLPEDERAQRLARQAVDLAKRALGERGPVWWSDGTPDYNRRLVRTTPYAAWQASLGTSPRLIS